MAEQEIPTEKELQAPITDRGDEAYQVLANEAGRRVHTVLQNLIEVRSRKTKGVLEGIEVIAILMGSITGLAALVSRMDLTAENAEPDAPPPEIMLLNDLANQFLNALQQYRETDPVARAMAVTSVPEGTTPS